MFRAKKTNYIGGGFNKDRMEEEEETYPMQEGILVSDSIPVPQVEGIPSSRHIQV